MTSSSPAAAACIQVTNRPAADIILAETEDLRSALLQHPVYARICDVPRFRFSCNITSLQSLILCGC